ncbi:MAG: 2-dehydro-3-deoxy-6-phosphogalactonate aldolase [Lentisphaeria bacterium]|nr:2-dehydro-3-deoxy-6-phosphogalactonate aldolase [Lentisphaeria bacterium]
MPTELKEKLLEAKVIAILRGIRPEEAIPFCEILAEEGILFPEIPLNTPGALSIIGLLANRFRGSGVHIGAGTVLSAGAAEEAVRAGAEYILSPNTDPAVIRRTLELGRLPIPGFQTPTEALLALESGAELLKFFPCASPESVTVLKSVIPAPIFAVGGICTENRAGYLAAADGVGVGIGICRPGISPQELRNNVRNFMK